MNPNPYSMRTKVGQRVQNKEYKSLYDLLETERILEPECLNYFEEKLTTKVVSVSRISHTLKSGKVYQFRVVVLIGNNKGIIGVGVSKAIAKATAIRKAESEAKKNLISLRSIAKDETLEEFCPIKKSFYKYGATKVSVSPLTGGSITASKNGALYCQLAGLTNLKIYVGSKKRDRKGKVGSLMNYFKALHEAIKLQC